MNVFRCGLAAALWSCCISKKGPDNNPIPPNTAHNMYESDNSGLYLLSNVLVIIPMIIIIINPKTMRRYCVMSLFTENVNPHLYTATHNSSANNIAILTEVYAASTFIFIQIEKIWIISMNIFAIVLFIQSRYAGYLKTNNPNDNNAMILQIAQMKYGISPFSCKIA